MAEKPDVITVEVVRNYLVNAAEDMKTTIMRTAMSPIIYEVLDFSTGIFDNRGRLAAQASGLAIFLGTLDWAVRASIDKYGVEGLYPGDVILSNDPYSGGGTHLNDVAVIMPVFYRGTLAGFAGVRAHWLDLGGKAPFSQMTDATEIYQEGLRLPVVKLRERGEINESLVEFIRANVRKPDAVAGDIEAQVAACRTGERRLAELFDKYGLQTVNRCMERIMGDSERATRDRLAALPDGIYCGSDSLDGPDSDSPAAAVRVKVIKRGSAVTFDFTESDPATRSSYNMGYCALVSAARVILKCITSPAVQANDGSFRLLRVVARPGTLVHAVPPTPICMYGETGRKVIDAVWKALGTICPDRLPAGHYGTVCAQGLAGWDTRTDPSRYCMHGGPNAGGWGAWEGTDGENALICISNGDTRNTPVEMIEAQNPLLVRRYELRRDSGGPGRFRGGLGTIIEYQVTTPGEFSGTFIVERHFFRPFGLEGGHPGAPNDVYIIRGKKKLTGLCKATGVRLQEGDIVGLASGGGGGYGEPRARDRDAVLEDLRRGYISFEAARRLYGL